MSPKKKNLNMFAHYLDIFRQCSLNLAQRWLSTYPTLMCAEDKFVTRPTSAFTRDQMLYIHYITTDVDDTQHKETFHQASHKGWEMEGDMLHSLPNVCFTILFSFHTGSTPLKSSEIIVLWFLFTCNFKFALAHYKKVKS